MQHYDNNQLQTLDLPDRFDNLELKGMSYHDGLYVAVFGRVVTSEILDNLIPIPASSGYLEIALSSDLTNWTAIAQSDSHDNSQIYSLESVEFGNGIYLAGGINRKRKPSLWQSPDAITWTWDSSFPSSDRVILDIVVCFNPRSSSGQSHFLIITDSSIYKGISGNWVLVSSLPDSLIAAKFARKDNYVGVVGSNQFYKSNDGGSTWTTDSTIPSQSYTDIAIADNKTVVSFSDPAGIIYLANQTWTTLTTPFASENAILSVLYYNGDYWLATSDTGKLYKSTNLNDWEIIIDADDPWLLFLPNPFVTGLIRFSLPKTLCRCTQLRRTDGFILGFTDCDRDVVIAEITYKASTAVAASNTSKNNSLDKDDAEIKSLLSSDAVNAEDLVNGRYRDADVTIASIDYLNPPDTLEEGYIINKWKVGECKLTNSQYTLEVRSLASALNQSVSVRTSPQCRYRFGDNNCKVQIPVYELTVAEVISPRRIRLSAFQPRLTKGTVAFTSGLNEGLIQEIASQDNDIIEFSARFPYEIEVGDEITVKAGCERWFQSCKDWGNHLNFGNLRPGGKGFMPGVGEMYFTGS